MSHPMVPPINLVGPTVEPYPGTFCLPQIPLPANISVKVGDNATIQLVEIAKHGAALYNCVDITFAEPEDVPKITRENCFNSTNITAQYVYTVDVDRTINGSSANPTQILRNSALIIPLLLVGYFGNFF
ncbi:conserved hypothetical protein [Uncinocarpus reesii 1704]|uniref:Copper acquisition factor BIM1-like domain-containing protein n=1 Tax=Uncinocarpus reesii (strain UAMH 1704) TaxID=336963 RepID=C4JLL0_UNCRE|nr:uncharacterized protein UREG_03718 [Uncinocarpus reesii 1704]EEP78872.1 conserved hypothetical protein [Uncinocarpus reesii 1704]